MKVVGYMRTDKVGLEAEHELKHQHRLITEFCAERNLDLRETFYEVALGEDAYREGLDMALNFSADAIVVIHAGIITDHVRGLINIPSRFREHRKQILSTWAGPIGQDKQCFDPNEESFEMDLRNAVFAAALG